MKELISIIVPVYNIENYLDKCIESIVHQTYKNLEILLIDDGSTDHSGKKCDEWAKKDKRIRVIHKKNGGVSSARNIGLEKAKGEYIGFVDGDDFVNKKMYEEMHRQMKKNNADFVICDYNECYNQNDNFKDRGKENNLIEILDKNGMFDKVYPYRGYVWQGLFLKEKLSAEVRFDSTKYVAEDLMPHVNRHQQKLQ